MNRIILIGNGFDLAHGLPTRYEDFIEWYWKQWEKRLKTSLKKTEQDQFCSFVLKDNIRLKGWGQVSSNHIKNLLKRYINSDNHKIDDDEYCDLNITSDFFSQICESIRSKGWVDIEWEYYNLICRFIKDPSNCIFTISELNNHLLFLTRLFIEYLTELKVSIPQSTNPKVSEIIYSPININDICISKLSAFWDYVDSILQQVDEYRNLLSLYSLTNSVIDGHIDYINILKNHYNDLVEYRKHYIVSEEYMGYSLNSCFFPKHVLLLNFNYTSLADNYKKRIASINHIHGIQYSPTSVIFGYGDELDDEYATLLKQPDNEYLKNIKSIKYLESVNYRNLLQFIESEPYQIYIMGHSCGNSDRTLLNTLFEHENCVSIKPYYYQKEDGSDNYLEIIQNICRNFTDMKLMRDRVVNKTYCEPLPQITN